jgi:hypothetical protein
MHSSADGRLSGIDRILVAMVSSPFVTQRLVTWEPKMAIRYFAHTPGKVVISV